MIFGNYSRKKTFHFPIDFRSMFLNAFRFLRLKREAEARVLTNRLLYGIKDDEEKEPKVEVDDRKRRYNNQFNPEMSRY